MASSTYYNTTSEVDFDLDVFVQLLDEDLQECGDDQERIIDRLLENSDCIYRLTDNVSPSTKSSEASSRSKYVYTPANMPVAHCKTLAEHRQRKKRKQAGHMPANPTIHDINPSCYACGARDMVDDVRNGDLVCKECATCTPNQITCDAYKCMPYDDYWAKKSMVDSATRRNCYSKSHYFTQLLDQLQGRGMEVFGADTLDVLVAEMGEPFDGTYNGRDVKLSMKRLGMNKLYSQAHTIASTLNRGHTNKAVFDRQEEKTLLRMFALVQPAYERNKGDRKNGLNYSYVMWQLFKLIGRGDMCSRLTMLKCKPRLRQHDELWAIICKELGWDYAAVTPKRQ